ncbi:hypothetical protein [Streptomyces sindenensis]|uniref:Uncharacterized protein n=1 Tax=Streptomyces sindenensis TaxID=67363 RepID=A0ABW6EP44_9ACTN
MEPPLTSPMSAQRAAVDPAPTVDKPVVTHWSPQRDEVTPRIV